MAHGPKACGCHIFSGGFTAGIVRNFDVVGQWEDSNFGAGTFQLNFPGVPHPTRWQDWPIDQFRGELDLFFANPPCAPWSIAGGHMGADDPRMAMTVQAMEAGLELEPQFFVLESVARAYTKGKWYYNEWAWKWLNKGYGVTYVLTDAVLHGLPSVRERFHFVAHKMGLQMSTPSDNPSFVTTVRDAIGDLPPPGTNGDPNHVVKPATEGELVVIRELRELERFDKAYPRLDARGAQYTKRRAMACRLAWDAPAPTVLDIHQMVHPSEDRWLTVREGLRLCGYPDDFTVDPAGGKWGGRPEDVTQAVTPTVGDWLGRRIMMSLDAARPLDHHETTGVQTVDFRPLAKPLQPRAFLKAGHRRG